MSLTYELSTMVPAQPHEDVEASAPRTDRPTLGEINRLLNLTDRDLCSVADLARWARILMQVCGQLEHARMHIDGRLEELVLEGIEPPTLLKDHDVLPAFLRKQAD